jgi:hypothetical protein
MRRLAAIAGVLWLCSCAATPPQQHAVAPPAEPRAAERPGVLRPFVHTGGFLHCVPFARHVSGIDIRGDAHTWWAGAAGRFERGQRPRVGSVLSLPASRGMTLGHVAVVVAVLEPRRILVSHANWGGDGDTRGVVHERMPVIDVSPANDWTQVRLTNTLGSFGRVYPANGFIHQTTLTAGAS